MRRYFLLTVLIISLLGVLDASFLTYEHYSGVLPPCSNSIWIDCGKVLKSKYSMVGQVPLSVLGLTFYSSMVGLSIIRLVIETEKKETLKDLLWKMVEKYARPRAWTLEKMLFYTQLLGTTTAAIMSTYLVYLQLGVIGAICLYCMFSAILSFTLFGVTLFEYFKIQKNKIF